MSTSSDIYSRPLFIVDKRYLVVPSNYLNVLLTEFVTALPIEYTVIQEYIITGPAVLPINTVTQKYIITNHRALPINPKIQ
jgi:hypothetical protein